MFSRYRRDVVVVLALLFLVTCLAGGSAHAGIIPVTSTGAGITPTNPDPNWTVNGGTAYVTDDSGFPFPTWSANDPGSSWISPQPSYTSSQTDLPGSYMYVTAFDLTGLVPSSAQLVFQFAVDNSLLDVWINSTSTGITGGGAGFAMSAPFTINSGFIAGVNTLVFLTQNSSGGSGNPAGLRVDISGTAVPEPATYALVAAGLLGLGFWRRRSSRAK